MARIKRYYTVDEITSNLYTSGKELMKTDNTEYIGLYHRYITGEVYSEATWNPSLSVQLIAYENKQERTVKTIYKTLKPNVNVLFSSPVTSTPVLTRDTIIDGIIQRYFIKRYDETSILEISQETYKDWQNNIIDKTLYTAISIKWKIKGVTIDQVTASNVIIDGVVSFNTNQIKKAENILPGVSLYLNNPLQYYVANLHYHNIDINGLN